RSNPKPQIIKHGPIRFVTETDVLENELALEPRCRPGAWKVADTRGPLQYFEYAFTRRHGIHKLHADFGQVLDRFVEIVHIRRKHHQIAGLQTSIENLHRSESDDECSPHDAQD